MFEYKSGIGIDAHQLEWGSQLIIGGVLIPHELGLLGHSDGDVLVHSIIDALLGSLTLGDIGSLFPSEDASLRGISSMELLKRVDKLRKESNWQVSHVDATIIAQKPALSPHIMDMRKNIDSVLSIGLSSINIKATTTDYLGFIGQEQGIAAMAVVTINRTQ
ncbi:MAG: 2-C-methyl-D-erythritol 2,4-cyclodiphosphate synthase [SAR202 cluster bacterium]|nr:2-C-methyl-D-erythritol 2,4-cyclodiphosphate synthase [SAR202 cluster bacterium]MQG87229.1 2-C-methyl-D-erythritol 2,4-cyclodiphosphate synthase [SAR202 cluster bacterium]|tara:strand:+ start:8112 stop:8597 length:486 start_codon:yes stop_codon:yes gene_type:complete